MGPIEINHVNQSGVHILRVVGELDLYNSYKLKDLVAKLTAGPIRGLILNLDKTSYIDSSGIGVLILTRSLCKNKNLFFRTVHVHGPVRRVIELTKLIGYLPILGTEEEALGEIGGAHGA